LGDLGNNFKQRRESLGLTLREVEESTKIRKKYLQALENENFDVIPGRTYTKGFLKNYALFLGLDAKEIIEKFEAEFVYPQDEDINTPLPHGTGRQGRKTFLGVALILVLAITLAAVGITYIGSHPEEIIPEQESVSTDAGNGEEQAESQPPSEQHPEQGPEGENSRTETQSPEVPSFSGVNLRVDIVDETCWVKAAVDGREVFRGTLRKGEFKVFEGNSQVVITLGNAGVAKLTFNGEEMPFFGKKGEVVTPPPFVKAEE